MLLPMSDDTARRPVSDGSVRANATETRLPGGLGSRGLPDGGGRPGVPTAPGSTVPGAASTIVADGTEPTAELEQVDQAELTGASILLVDDNPQNLELIQAYLEGLPCTIRTASDGVEAVAEIERSQPDLVLLDVMMPRMSGFEVCQKIKGNPRTRDIVVIMVTALHEVGDYERAHECGTDDFLTKPVNKLELLIRVKSLLRVRMLKKQINALRAKYGIEEPVLDQLGDQLGDPLRDQFGSSLGDAEDDLRL